MLQTSCSDENSHFYKKLTTSLQTLHHTTNAENILVTELFESDVSIYFVYNLTLKDVTGLHVCVKPSKVLKGRKTETGKQKEQEEIR